MDMIVGIRGHENQIQFNSIQFNSIVYIQVTIFKYLVIHALSPASMNSTSSFLPVFMSFYAEGLYFGLVEAQDHAETRSWEGLACA